MRKKTFYCYLMAVCLMGGFSLSSCNDDDNINTESGTGRINPDLDGVEYEVSDSTTLTASQVADLVYGPEGSNADEDVQKARAKFLEKAQKMADDYAAQSDGANGVVTSFHWVNYKYWSTDELGQRIKLSAKVLWARFGFKIFGLDMAKDLDPDNIYLVEHYNISNNSTVPSQTFCMDEQLFYDNLVIMPDYIGFGETKDRVHPLMNFDVNAKNSYDALEAGYKIYKDTKDSGTDLEKDAKLYIIGGNIGAAYGLATQKYIETNNLDKKWNFAYSYLCAGPYSAPITVNDWWDSGKIQQLAYIPMLIKGMFASYPDIMKKNGQTESLFYCSNYLNKMSDIDEMLAKKDKSVLGASMTMSYMLRDTTSSSGPLTLILSDLSKNSSIVWDLFECLEKNDLTKGWTPKHMIKLYEDDRDVAHLFTNGNAKALKEAFGDKVNIFWSYVISGEDATLEKWRFTLFWGNW